MSSIEITTVLQDISGSLCWDAAAFFERCGEPITEACALHDLIVDIMQDLSCSGVKLTV